MLTAGDRIKYYRKRHGLTQEQLAELANIHPVSIRKYETNKMQPQAAQVERIAEVLHVNRSAIDGFNASISLETFGDLAGLLMEWHKAGILTIQGVRDSKKFITAKSAHFVLNPLFREMLQFTASEGKKKMPILWEDIVLSMKNPILLSDLLKWEHFYGALVSASKYIEKAEKKTIDSYLELQSTVEAIEMELISNQKPLNIHKAL